MPWHEVSTMSLRRELVMLAEQAGVNVRALCRRFGISPKTGYKWVHRFHAEGVGGLAERSRRPHHSPGCTPPHVAAPVLAVRDAHPAWGGRKIRARLQMLGQPVVPAASTVTAILRRAGRLNPADAAKHTPWQRFEQPVPNALWQMDFKGHVALAAGRCHPLTVLDDHSRYALCLQACTNEQGPTVQATLTTTFQRYGMPARMLMDNGPPWGDDWEHPYTPLTVWLLRVGVGVCHGRPYHPQTQGKDERFHRTLTAEVLQRRLFCDLAECQQAFAAWRDVYNCERPHEALGGAPPISRYTPSPRPFPMSLPPIEYRPGDVVRKVQHEGEFSFRGHTHRVSKAFRGYPIGLRATDTDGVLDVYFSHHCISQLDLRKSP
ncbi:MAG: IS481 family transposase [Nitrospiraceae bacterium]